MKQLVNLVQKITFSCVGISMLSACTVLPPQAMTHTPQFEPVYPALMESSKQATGAIYVGRQSDSWFGKGRNFQVGDVITVLLKMPTSAGSRAMTLRPKAFKIMAQDWVA